MRTASEIMAASEPAPAVSVVQEPVGWAWRHRLGTAWGYTTDAHYAKALDPLVYETTHLYAAPVPQQEPGEVTDEMVTRFMREFEQWTPLLRYKEAEKWHLNDIQGVRHALRAALRSTTGGENDR